MAGFLLFAAAVLSIVGVASDRGVITELSWFVWALGILLLIRRTLHRRKYGTPELLSAAAAAGDARAMRSLAMVAKLRDDYDEAERLLRRGVDVGDVESMWEMGRLVEHRDGLQASEPWFRMAAERGHFSAKRFFRPGHALNMDGSNPL
ncbi:sel1 repeat family protein [Streptomyces atroolivaceus]|uniref:sel1 repeat family protein n=1 Tax=Streptomyces atroolivaceus TaxID=66869 RepID=UPI0033C4F344